MAGNSTGHVGPMANDVLVLSIIILGAVIFRDDGGAPAGAPDAVVVELLPHVNVYKSYK